MSILILSTARLLINDGNLFCSYFSSKETDSKMASNRKSKLHLSNGSLKDPIIDDSKNFLTTDQVKGSTFVYVPHPFYGLRYAGAMT